MSAEAGRPISGRDSRVAWLRTELAHQLGKATANLVTTKEILGWFLRHGYSIGFSRDELLFSLQDDIDLLQVAGGLKDEEIRAGKPPPDFSPGQSVHVVLNARNTTYHQGLIAEVLWHHKDGIWNYQIVENGKRIAKRYEARDLMSTGTSFL